VTVVAAGHVHLLQRKKSAAHLASACADAEQVVILIIENQTCLPRSFFIAKAVFIRLILLECRPRKIEKVTGRT
jgi:hypothetical protein